MGRTNPGPEYIRAEEWIERRSGQRSKRRRRALALACVALVAAAAVWRGPSIAVSIEIGGTLSRIDAAKAISVVASPFSDAGVKSPMVWGEWVSGAFQRQYVVGGVSVERRGKEMFASDRVGNGMIEGFDMSSLDGRTVVRRMLAEALSDGMRRVKGREGPVSWSEFEVVRGAERVHFWIDEGTHRLVNCVVSHLGPEGWTPVAEFDAELGAAFTSIMNSVDPGKQRQIPTPHEVEKELPLARGNAIKIGPVSLASNGTVFVVLHTEQTEVSPYVTDDRGMPYFLATDKRVWSDIPAVEYMFVPLDESTASEGRTLQFHFPSRIPGRSNTLPPRDLAVYERRFEKPTCEVEPPYRSIHSASTLDTLIEEALTRGAHLEQIARYNDGTPVDLAAGEALSRVDETPSTRTRDRRLALVAYRKALVLMTLSGRLGGTNRATMWFRLFDLESQFGDPEVAKQCIATARTYSRRDGRQPDAAAIRRAYESVQ